MSDEVCQDVRVQTTLEAFRAGDPDAVRTIYRKFAGPVQAVVASLIGDPELRADAVEQTFVRAWHAASTFDADREMAPWLYSIARRTAIDVLRAGDSPTPHDRADEVDASLPPRSFQETWEAFEIRRAIDDLPPEERAVMKLAHAEGMAQPEIAQALDVPLSTVTFRADRAQWRLAAALRQLISESGAPSSGVEGDGAQR